MPAYLSLFVLVARFLLLPALGSAQAVTFKTVQDCITYQYDQVAQGLCTLSNECNVDLCSPEYKGGDSYKDVVVHCEALMQAPPGVVEPIMEATCKSKQGSQANATSIVVPAVVGSIIGLILIAIIGLFAYHKSRQSIAIFVACGIHGATCPSRSRNRGVSGVYGVPNIAPTNSAANSRKLSPLNMGAAPYVHSPTAISFVQPRVDEATSVSSSSNSGMAQIRPPYYETANTYYSTPSTPVTPSAPPTPSSPTPLMMYPPSPSTHLDALDYSPSRPKYWI